MKKLNNSRLNLKIDLLSNVVKNSDIKEVLDLPTQGLEPQVHFFTLKAR
jgi:hypothetical protein